MTPEAREAKKAYDREWRRTHREVVNQTIRSWKAKNRDKVAAVRKKHKADNPEKTRARNIIYLRIMRGSLMRPSQCERCEVACKPEAHHPDYSKPLEVKWLCRPCHLVADAAQMRKGKNTLGRAK